MSFEHVEMLWLEENKYLRLPLAGGVEWDLPAFLFFNGSTLAPLGLIGITGMAGAREDGEDFSYFSLEKVKSNYSSSSKQPSTRNPSIDVDLLATSDPSPSLMVLRPAPLVGMTAGGLDLGLVYAK